VAEERNESCVHAAKDTHPGAPEPALLPGPARAT
jgi:hypothetical protein